MMTDDEDIQALANLIRCYLEAHPNAADALDGIMAWWLGPGRTKLGRREVSMALDLLIEQGWVKKSNHTGGEPVYSRVSPAQD